MRLLFLLLLGGCASVPETKVEYKDEIRELTLSTPKEYDIEFNPETKTFKLVSKQNETLLQEAGAANARATEAAARLLESILTDE